MDDLKDNWWVYLHKEAQEKIVGETGFIATIQSTDHEDAPIFKCVSIEPTPIEFLKLRVLVPNDVIIDLMIPRTYIAYIIGGEKRKEIGFRPAVVKH